MGAVGRPSAEATVAARVGPYCDDEWTSEAGPYYCTLSFEHDGPHVAHLPGDRVAAYWQAGVGQVV